MQQFCSPVPKVVEPEGKGIDDSDEEFNPDNWGQFHLAELSNARKMMGALERSGGS